MSPEKGQCWLFVSPEEGWWLLMSPEQGQFWLLVSPEKGWCWLVVLIQFAHSWGICRR
jgi:hypothetical protein